MMKSATTRSLLQNWWGYTNYFLDQRPYLKLGIGIASLAITTTMCWPIGLGIKAFATFGVTALTFNFVGYAVGGSANLIQNLYSHFSAVKNHFDAGLADDNDLFAQLFVESPEPVARAIEANLKLGLQRKFEEAIEGYADNKVPTDFSKELDGFINGFVENEIKQYCLPLDYAFHLYEINQRNQGKTADDPVFAKLSASLISLKDQFKEKYVGPLTEKLKASLNTEANESYFWAKIYRGMLDKHLSGKKPRAVLGFKKGASTSEIKKAFFNKSLKQHPDKASEIIGDYDGSKNLIARDLAILKCKKIRKTP